MTSFSFVNMFLPPTPPSTPPRLEILSALPADPDPALPPLLFVHGAFCGAWVWQEHFLGWFAERGYEAYAVSLRGHGGSEGRGRLHDTGFDEYVEDLSRTVASLTRDSGRVPVVIGHSMGGMVTQRWIERFDRTTIATRPPCAAVLLMSSVPPSGLAGTGLHMAFTDPSLVWQLSAMQAFGENMGPLSVVERAMFAPDAPPELITRYVAMMQDESMRAPIDMNCALPPVATNGKALPMLVIGADHDGLIPDWMNRTTAQYYDTDCLILPDTGHAMMLGPTWPDAAAAIHDWLTSHEIGRHGAAAPVTG